jgi:4a-hydroxytetrahydrobiopterin dehydratase
MEPLDQKIIEEKLSDLKGWSFRDDAIHKTFEFENFKESLGFIVRLGLEAEALQHHPTITNTYNTVDITLSTHDAGDKVTLKDIDLATQIESIL